MALVAELLRRVLRYLGWPPEQAVYLESRVSSSSIRRTIRTCIPSAVSSRRHFQHLYAILRKCQVKVISFCQKKEYGSTRSIVRRLGTILSLEPSPRPYFQLVQDLGYDEQSIAPAPAAPSLADVLWVANDEGEASTRLKTEFWRKEKSAPYCGLNPPLDSIQTVPKSSAESDSLVGQAALQKISVLEEELTFLRAQIAAVVSAQTLGSIPPQLHPEAFKAFSTLDGFYPVPAMTSTPLPISHNHFVIPSPPPLSCGALSGVDTCNSAIELIKQRRAARSSGSTAADGVDHQKTKSVPSMMDVLKDLNKVQLRAVERSPGGTPLSRPKKRQSSDWDPVALLTHALKQKFAHRNNYEDDSLDKENRSFDTSSFSSPEMPLVGRCSWKPNAKSSLTKTEEVKPVSVWKVEAHL